MGQAKEKQKIEAILKNISLNIVDLLQLKDEELKEIVKAYDYELKNHKSYKELSTFPDVVKVYIILTEFFIRKEMNVHGNVLAIEFSNLRSKLENFMECEKYLKQYDHI